MFGSSKKSSSGGQQGSSKGGRVSAADDASYQLALRLQQEDDEQSGYVKPPKTASSGPARQQASKSSDMPPSSPTLPDEIQDDIDAVQEFICPLLATSCRSCGIKILPDFSAVKWFEGWQTAQRNNETPSLSTGICPRDKCRSYTCLGCGKEPSRGRRQRKVEGYVIDWCCQKARLFAIWILLCKYDDIELELQFRSEKNTKVLQAKYNQQKAHTNSTGTGYDDEVRGRGYGYGYDNPYGRDLYGRNQHPLAPPALDFRKADAEADRMYRKLFSFVTELLPLRENESAPEAVSEMIELSFFQDRAAQILRNDSITDVSKRVPLYLALLPFVEKVGTNKDTRFLVTDARFAKKKSPGLEILSMADQALDGKGKGKERGPGKGSSKLLEVEKSKDSMSLSLVGCMENLSIQSSSLLKTANKGFGDSSGKEMLALAKLIVEVHERLKGGSSKITTKKSLGSTSTWKEYNTANRVNGAHELMSTLEPKIRAKASYLLESRRNRMRKITMELADMTTSLTDGILLKYQEDRPDVMKCLIIGPDDTPYEGGLFEFDIWCQADYPNVPPIVWFRTTNNGRVVFNPNLHLDGKVCQSILGTWPGPPEMQWQPGRSTILQVLIGIQAMIFNSDPFENNPGELKQDVSEAQLRKLSSSYIPRLQAWTTKFAMMDWLTKPYMRDGIWSDVVAKYFALNGNKVIATVQKWAAKNKEIEIYTGGEDPHRNYDGFRGVYTFGYGGPRSVNLLQDLSNALRKHSKSAA